VGRGVLAHRTERAREAAGPKRADRREIENEESGFTVRLRRPLLFPLVAVLGAAVVVLPALAASSEAKLEVNDNCVAANWPCWTSSSASNPPPTNVTTIAQGGVVTFVDNTGVAASLAWTGTAPTCSASVPVSPAAAKAGWEGTCTFEAPGHYKFESTTLYAAYTKYEIVVQAPASTSTSTTTAGTTTTGTTTTGATTGSTTPSYGSSGGSEQPGEPAAAGGASGAPLIASGPAAVELGAIRHGRALRGSLDLTPAAAGSRLEVELLATRASLASAAGSARVRVGRLARSSLPAGVSTFTVALNAAARHALQVRGRLALSVEIVLSPAHGAPLRLERSVVVRR
jgi:hypothetical protein